MKSLRVIAMLLALSVATPAVAQNGIITPDIAVGFENVVICSTSPSGEMLVSGSSMCFTKETHTPARYIKTNYPTRTYTGFQVAPGSSSARVLLFYR